MPVFNMTHSFRGCRGPTHAAAPREFLESLRLFSLAVVRSSLGAAAIAVAVVASGLFLIVGVVNLLPVIGVLSTTRLHGLYGVVVEEPNLAILMRHRAALLGIIGALLVASAFHAPLQPLAVTVGLVSMLSFVLIAHLVDGYNAELRRIVFIDLVASALLVGAGMASVGAQIPGAVT